MYKLNKGLRVEGYWVYVASIDQSPLSVGCGQYRVGSIYTALPRIFLAARLWCVHLGARVIFFLNNPHTFTPKKPCLYMDLKMWPSGGWTSRCASRWASRCATRWTRRCASKYTPRLRSKTCVSVVNCESSSLGAPKKNVCCYLALSWRSYAFSVPHHD